MSESTYHCDRISKYFSFTLGVFNEKTLMLQVALLAKTRIDFNYHKQG